LGKKAEAGMWILEVEGEEVVASMKIYSYLKFNDIGYSGRAKKI